MNVVLMYVLLLCSSFAWSYPSVSINFLKPIPSSIYFGETLRIPLVMSFYNLSENLYWIELLGGNLEIVSGYCPPIQPNYGRYGSGTCYMNLVLTGRSLGQSFSGSLKYRVIGKDGHSPKPHEWNYTFPSPYINVQVIPHCPSMLVIPIQEATAGQNFNLNLNRFVAYSDENIQANTPAQMEVTPVQQDGLSFNAANSTLVGSPTLLGVYTFTVSAKNNQCTAQETTVTVYVKANSSDTPIFKKDPSLINAFPKQKYSMNLMELIESAPKLMVNNQVQFRIKSASQNANWLHISDADPIRLEGIVPEESAGQIVHITLIATSNTGGDSLPMELSFPIAYDKTKQPHIKSFSLHETAGAMLDFDLSNYVTNPSGEPFELFIDKVEPLASWLSHNKNSLTGLVPLTAVGQLYQVTLIVSDNVGGPSNPITIPLQVRINKEKTPQFKSTLMLPTAIPGQPYLYDFKEHNVVVPEEIPYDVQFASDYPNPGWIELKNNQLIVDEVPDVNTSAVTLYLKIKNTPGGLSELIKVDLSVLTNKDVTNNDTNIHG